MNLPAHTPAHHTARYVTRLEDLAVVHTPDAAPVPAADLHAGERITIGRYDVQLVLDPLPAPMRLIDGAQEVMLLVHEAGADPASAWWVTVGATQLFTPSTR